MASAYNLSMTACVLSGPSADSTASSARRLVRVGLEGFIYRSRPDSPFRGQSLRRRSMEDTATSAECIPAKVASHVCSRSRVEDSPQVDRGEALTFTGGESRHAWWPCFLRRALPGG